MEFDELIERYFANKLDEEERRLFDDLLDNNQEFQEEFAFQQNLKKAITKTNRENRKATLKGVESDLKQSKPIKPILGWQRLSIAATILLLIGLGWFTDIFTSPDFEGLYADNYRNYPNTEYSISRGTDENTLERKAFLAYEAQDYIEAIAHFMELRKQGAEYADFYLGQSYLGDDQPLQAISVFKDIISQNKSYAEESQWYLALSYLRIKDKESAMGQLMEITSGYKHIEAQQLLERLN